MSRTRPQNVPRWTLAWVYCVRPCPGATVSTSSTRHELPAGRASDDVRRDNVPPRRARVGQLVARLLAQHDRAALEVAS